MKDVNGRKVRVGDKVIMNCLRNKGRVGVFSGFAGKGEETGVVTYSGSYADSEGGEWPDFIYVSDEMFEVFNER